MTHIYVIKKKIKTVVKPFYICKKYMQAHLTYFRGGIKGSFEDKGHLSFQDLSQISRILRQCFPSFRFFLFGFSFW